MVTVNTDGETSLAAEYQRAREIFGYSDAELANLARASVEGSFAPAGLKAQVRAEIDQWLSR
jgi:adenosine deaminase